MLPDEWIEGASSEEELFLLMCLAEKITRSLSERGERLPEKDGTPLEYSLGDAAEEAYRIQSAVLNSPEYYNAAKIMQHFLLSTPPSSAEDEYVAFRGQYKKSREGDQHSFIEVVHEGSLSRVLISEKKHVPPNLRDAFAELLVFDRQGYESLETALLAFNSFKASLDRFSRDLDSRHDMLNGGLAKADPQVSREIENCLHFLLSNVSGMYQEASELHNLIQAAGPLNHDLALRLYETFRRAEGEYSDFMYRNVIDQGMFEGRFSPEVKSQDVAFGEAYAREAAERGVSGFDEELCRSDISIRMVSVDFMLDDPSQTIPFHVEESCLDALRIDRNRPLINVIGGCRQLDSAENPLDVFGEAVVNVAHRHKANVGVPGTQSGIGSVFGRENVNYKTRFGHLPFADQAHVFSVNPGGSVFFPGNHLIDQHPGTVYANAPIDTLVTPIPAEWNRKGLDKYNSKYITHIAYMEAIYRRMSADQRHVMVVGNGGCIA